MEKMNGESMNIERENIKRLKEIFPEVFTEDKIDFEKLQLILGEDIEESEERYSFNWNGKRDAIRLSQTPTTGTLRPDKDNSKNWDETENLYIEGDNLEVLKLLQKSYHRKIKMIYIDPPYNTGTDIIYKNDFSDSIKYYKAFTGQIDSEGYDISTNTESDGKFHTNWLNMMYPRLRLARNLLTDDGIIIISIDDYEFYNLKKICDEIFGEYNFVGNIITRCNPQGRGKDNIDPVHEYNFIYAKNIDKMPKLKIEREKNKNEYNYLIRSGTNSRKFERPRRFYPLLIKNNQVSCITFDEYNKIYVDGEFDEVFLKDLESRYARRGYKVIYPIAQNGEEKVWQRKFERVYKECDSYIYENGQVKTPALKHRTPQSLWLDEKYSNSGSGTNVLIDLFDGLKPFDFPKSYKTVKDFVSLFVDTDDFIVLDFFSGSSTTAHAVMDLNAEDKGNRKFIMVQLPESIKSYYQRADKDRKKELKKVMDFLEENNKELVLTEVGKERIRRAGDKILENLKEKYEKASEEERKNMKNPDDLDIGFKSFKLDSSNIKEWNPEYMDKDFTMEDLVNNFVPNRNEEDILYEIILKYGIDLTAPIEEHKVNGKTIYNVGFGAIYICLDNHIDNDVVEEILKLNEENKMPNPMVVFKDTGFKNDEIKLNAKLSLNDNGIEEVVSI